MPDSLAIFHPLIQAWFRENLGVPTDIQRQAWPPIAAGKHVLLTAPTGSGKTLTAFLSALDRLIAGAWPAGGTRILYVSPLKALNNDVQRNLIAPLAAIGGYFRRAGEPFPEVRVQVRSGDTPATERRRMLKHPPGILITTPESLNLMLLSPAGRDALKDVAVVILDEIHAVAGSKRGVHLITAVDRLVPLAGEFQRIALSATVKPLEAVAAFVGGYTLGGTGYSPRPVTTVVSRAPKTYELQVSYPVDISADKEPMPALAPAGEPDIWSAIAAEIKRLIAGARSTLVFTNNRRLAERIARLLNDGEPVPVAYAHHGSLSREIRSVVEGRMKEGRLQAIVATNSLELGIDIGALDQVILVQTPFSIASALQKIGRAGHGVGQISRGRIFASHGRDALDAAVAVKCILDGDIEDLRLVEGPLDLLAQILVSLAAAETWTLDRLYAFIRTSHPYRNLPRSHFDLVVEMLAGRFEETRIRELKPRLSVDAVDGRVRALKGATLALALGGGTIPDRGYYAIRHADSRAKIGELDEEFVWERRAGEIFALGSQSWKIARITANDVEVVPAGRDAQMAPFWRAEERDRGFHFSLRLGEFLESADARLEDPGFRNELREACHLDDTTAAAVQSFLRRQKEATKAVLPHRHHLLVEDAGSAPGSEASGEGNRQVILHAVWGGRLNRPWAYALAAAWEERTGLSLEIIPGDDCLLVQLPPGEPAAGLLDWVHAGNLETLLRRRLEKTGYFVAHFRENAARALLLPRSTLRARMPLWLNRIRSHNLLEAVSGFADFPIVLETWRECLRDEFDLPSLKAMLDELHGGAIRVSETRTLEPSPFAEGILWKQTNQFMYEGNRPAEGKPRPREDLLREIAFSSPLRPKVPLEVIRDFEAKAQRVAPGYAPQDARELVDWVKERLLIPWPEWLRLLSLCGAPMEEDALGEHQGYLASRLLGLSLPGAAAAVVAAVESLPRLFASLSVDRGEALYFLPLPAGSSIPPVSSVLPMPSTPDSSRPPDPRAMASLEKLGLDREGARSADADGEADLPPVISQWLRSYGPVTPEFLRTVFGRAFPKVEEALEDLAEGDRIVSDVLSESAAGTEVCDAANLELLLRLMRRRSRPAVQALPAGRLPLFLAAWQGLTDPAPDLEGLQAALEKLFGYPAPAAAWESEFLPARVMPYRTVWLDDLFRDDDLAWFGCGREKISFAFPEDLELFLPAVPTEVPAGPEPPSPSTPSDQVLDLLARAAPARLDYQALSAQSPLPSDRLTESLWDLAWHGRITNDTFAALRKGVETGFQFRTPDTGLGREGANARAGATAPSRRGRFQRWKAVRPLAGDWRLLDRGDPEADALEREELSKDRVRQLLRRHGLLFRGLLDHELPALQWSQVFRALRLLELSGEILSGHFFAGIPGLQFLSPQALRLMEGGLPEDAVYWMNAADPASPCALGLEGLPYPLPPRLPSTHLVFHGADLAMTSRRMGRDLAFRVPPRHTYLASYLGSLRHLVDRPFQPLKAVEVETVNGEPVLGSPYLEDLLDAGFEKGIKSVSLRKRY